MENNDNIPSLSNAAPSSKSTPDMVKDGKKVGNPFFKVGIWLFRIVIVMMFLMN